MADDVAKGTHGVPSVFLSYAHDDDAHLSAVLGFANLLVTQGVDVVIDRWHEHTRKDWYAWALREIKAANFVMVVASPQYRAVGDGSGPSDRHRGVQAETTALRELLYGDRETWFGRVLPVVLPGRSVNELPAFTQPYTASHFVVAQMTSEGVEDLLRVLTGQPRYVPPARGPVRRLANGQNRQPTEASGPLHAPRHRKRFRVIGSAVVGLTMVVVAALAVAILVDDTESGNSAVGPTRSTTSTPLDDLPSSKPYTSNPPSEPNPAVSVSILSPTINSLVDWKQPILIKVSSIADGQVPWIYIRGMGVRQVWPQRCDQQPGDTELFDCVGWYGEEIESQGKQFRITAVVVDREGDRMLAELQSRNDGGGAPFELDQPPTDPIASSGDLTVTRR